MKPGTRTQSVLDNLILENSEHQQTHKKTNDLHYIQDADQFNSNQFTLNQLDRDLELGYNSAGDQDGKHQQKKGWT